MVFLRYLTCIVAAFAVISYTVYLEVHTPVVYKVKTTLGLDTSNIDAARAGLSQPGLWETALTYFEDRKGVPSFSEVLAGAPAEQRSNQLPEPLVGWMRVDEQVNLTAVRAFEGKYLHSETVDTSEQFQDAENSRMAGAYYYREDMEMLVTISALPKSMAIAASQLQVAKGLTGTADDTVAFNGATLPIKRHKRSGFGLVQTLIGDRIMVQLRGDVPDSVFEAYLDAFDWDVLASL